MGFSSLAITLALAFGFSGRAFAWVPDGKPSPGFTPACHPQLWSRKYLATRDSGGRDILFKRFLTECTGQSQSGRPSGAAAERDFADIEDHSRRGWEWHEFLDRSAQPKAGWLLMQPRGEGPRPLAVIACDFDCSPESNAWLKALTMALYDEGRMNLFIVLSPEQAGSSLWLAGGVQYGRDLLEAGFWVQLISPYRGRFSSAHVLGMGWSAHASLAAQIYNDQNPIADDRKVFHSVLSFCPNVDLGATLNEIDQPANEMMFRFSNEVRAHAASLKERHPEWNAWLGDWSPAVPLSDKWVRASLLQTWNRGFQWLSPFRADPPRSPGAWLETNDFLLQTLGVKTPGWVVGAAWDPRFPAEQHWLPLARQHSDPRKSSLRVAGFESDTTCAFASSHGWAFASTLIRTLVQQEAYEIWPRREASTRSPWPAKSPALFDGESHLDQHWEMTARGSIEITYLIGRGDLGAGNVSVRQITQTVPAKALPKGMALSPDRLAATRQLNAWLRLRGESGPLVQSRQTAEVLEFMK